MHSVLALPRFDTIMQVFLQVKEAVLIVFIQELADYLESLIDRVRRVRRCSFAVEFEKDRHLD